MGCGSSMSTVQVVSAPHNKHEASQLNDLPSTKSFPIQQSMKQGDSPNKQQKKQDRVQTSSTDDMRHQPMKHVPEGRGFLFGQSSNQRKIIMLDCEKMQFSILSSRGQVPPTPHKYQPKDIILQESQEMLASNLFNKNSHPPYNFMFITFIEDETIFLCGGVNYEFDYVSEETFFYRVNKSEEVQLNSPAIKRSKRAIGNNLVGTKFQKLDYMHYKRYSHMGAYFKIGKLGYIYVFGGRGEDDELLNSCEQYSIEEKKWREMPAMRMPRSTGFSLIFKSKIYVFGGYTGEKKRSKVIQVFDPFKNYWEPLNVKLHRGIEAGLIFSVKPNQIIILGGNMELGSLKSVIKINLAEQTYIWDSNMKNQRLLQKGLKFNDTIYVFGGDFHDNFQKYTIKDRKWKDFQFSYTEYISADDINSFSMATQTLEVIYDQSSIIKQENLGNQYERLHIFGNDQFPCILQINLSKWVLKKKAVPMTLRLRTQMGVAKVVEGKYFLCGGVDDFNQKTSKSSFIYYASTGHAIQVDKMLIKKYQFAICSTPKNVYIFGGRLTAQSDIIQQCEKYSFEQQKWISLPNLSRERSGAKTLLLSHQILIFGGVDSIQSLSQIEIFNIQTENFSTFKPNLSISSQIKSLYWDRNSKESCPNIYLFSNNEVTGKYSCHHIEVNLQESQGKDERQGKEEELPLKVLSFHHSFQVNQKYYFITSKGLFYWEPAAIPPSQQFQSQIVINQVEMLQFPIQKFSFPS